MSSRSTLKALERAVLALVVAGAGCNTPTGPEAASSSGTPSSDAASAVPAPSAAPAPVQPSTPIQKSCATQGSSADGIPWKPTSAMALSPMVRSIVQQIQDECTWDQFRFQLSKPTRRAEWMKALSSIWTKAEAVELLSHEAPSVRGYAAYEIVRQFPESASLIRRIFSDESRVRWAWVDYGETSPLSAMLAGDLCKLASPAADAELLWALRNAPAEFRRKEVFACVRKRKPVEVASVAFHTLQTREDVEGLRTLGFAPIPEYLPVVQRFAQSSSVQTRLAAAMTLASFEGNDARRALQPLIADPDPQVRAAANTSLWRLDEASAAEVEKLLKRTDGLEKVAAETLIWFPTEKTLSVVERYLVAHPDDEVAMQALVAQRPSPLFLSKMRNWADRIWRSSARYNDVLRYLAESKDAAAAAIFNSALQMRSWTTIIHGAKGLAAIGSASVPYVPNLERALRDNNAFVVAGAADALLALEARDSVSRLREAQAKLPKGSWAERRIGEVISELASKR